ALAKAAGNKFAILPFAKEPGQPKSSPHALREDSVSPTAKSSPNSDSTVVSRSETTTMGTNIEAALEAAVASLPPGYVPRVVLVSAGNETRGDALKPSLKAGLPISTVPLQTRSEPEVQVSAVTLPAQVRQGEPFYVEVVINSNHDDEGTITVYRG